MNICFVVGSLRGGGAERVVINLSSRFAQLGHKTTILTITDNLCDYELSKDVGLYYVAAKTSIPGLRMLSRMNELNKLSHQLETDIIIAFAGANVVTAFTFLLSKEKVVLSERNDPSILPKSKVAKIIRNIAYRSADALVFQTKDAQDYFNRLKNKKAIIKNPIGPNIPKNSSKINNVFVNVGRLCEQKNQMLLIDAFTEVLKSHNDVMLKIYGKGPLEKELMEFIKTKKATENIKLCGHSKNLLEEIKNDKYFVLSSDYEGMSNALVEAMAMGMTVISTDHPIGGARELIQDKKNGLLVPVKNKEALVEAMLTCIKNEKQSIEMAESAKEINKTLELNKIAGQWLALLGEVVNG